MQLFMVILLHSSKTVLLEHLLQIIGEPKVIMQMLLRDLVVMAVAASKSLMNGKKKFSRANTREVRKAWTLLNT